MPLDLTHHSAGPGLCECQLLYLPITYFLLWPVFLQYSSSNSPFPFLLAFRYFPTRAFRYWFLECMSILPMYPPREFGLHSI
jgi:hypothetical protein